MTTYILKRLLLVPPTVLGVSILVFFVMRLIPGNALDVILGVEGTVSAETRAYFLRMVGLDAPLHVQFLRFLSDLVQLNFGFSLRTQRPVVDLLWQRLPITVELALLSVLFSLPIGVALGILSAARPGGRSDLLSRLVGLAGLSLPNFWLATMLILVASRFLGWLPPLIWASPFAEPGDNLKIMLLPAVSLGLPLAAMVMRMTRSSMLEVLRQEYITTAVAKGLPGRTVVYRHALRNALIPVVTVAGAQMGYLLSGAVVVEQIFGIPGIGWMLLTGVYQRDYPVVQGAILCTAFLFVLVNLAVDVLYAYLNPRIRYA